MRLFRWYIYMIFYSSSLTVAYTYNKGYKLHVKKKFGDYKKAFYSLFAKNAITPLDDFLHFSSKSAFREWKISYKLG